LTIIWGSFFFLNVGIVGYMYFRGWIGEDSGWNAVTELSANYIPYFGVTLGFYFGYSRSRIGEGYTSRVALGLAFFTSLFWNLTVCALLVRVFMAGTINEFMTNLRNVVFVFSWLVAPAMGYYFGASSDSD
jgi:hypothetical protein